MIEEIMTERLKNPTTNGMIDAEALAQQDSQTAFDQMQAAQSKIMNSAIARSDGGSQKSAKGSSKQRSSQSKANESVSKS